MRILLLNDNPVVRKLVALSAQKTKDDLDVIWSLDEIEYPNYDLFIVDDALYSDEAMQQLKKKITFKSSLLMATRGASTPAGFDKVINKPFLPTDLVELFVGIANSLPSVNFDDPKGAIDVMDDVLDELLDDDMLTDDSQEYNLDDLIDEEIPLKTNILDSQEVQELQGLLGDTESDDNNELDGAEFEMLDIEETEDLGQESQGDFVPSLGIDELDELDEFNEEELNELKETQEDELSDDELEAMLLSGNVKSESSKEDNVDLEALLAEMSAEELLNEPMSDDDFEDLEQQIQEAMGNLEKVFDAGVLAAEGVAMPPSHWSTIVCIDIGSSPGPWKHPLICLCAPFIPTPPCTSTVIATCSATLLMHHMTPSSMHTANFFFSE